MKGSELARAPGDLLGRRTSRSGSPEAGGGWPGARQMERPRGSASCGAGRRKGSVCLGVRTATGHEGSRKGSGLRETGDGEAHRWLFLFRTLDRYIIILLLLLLLLSLLLFFREKKKNNPPIIPEGSHFWMGAKMDCRHLKIQRLAGYHLARAE